MKKSDAVLLALVVVFGSGWAWTAYRRAVEHRAANVERLKAVSDARAAAQGRPAGAEPGPAGDSAGATKPEDAVVPGWPGVAREGHVIGDTAATVRVVLFGDYLCPHCRNMAPTVRALADAYAGRVAIVYRNFPIFGTRSWTTAMAAECAARQRSFPEVYDALNRRMVLSGIDWPGTLVKEAAIPDAAAFRRCLAREETRARVQADYAAAATVGASGTPAIIVNGRLYEGEYPLEAMQQLIENALAHPR